MQLTLIKVIVRCVSVTRAWYAKNLGHQDLVAFFVPSRVR